jgi:nucleoside-diphosphate-sugar epimerase
VEPGAFWSSPENVRWVEASLALLRAFADAGGQRAVVAGTCAEYDWSAGVCVEGETPLVPATLYGTCKHGLHTVAAGLAAEQGLSLAWGRIFFLYGPGEHPSRLVPAVILPLLRGEPAELTEGSQERDFLHVADVAGAFAALVDSEVEGAVNVASGERTSVRALAELAGEITGRPDLLRFGALPSRPGDPPLIVGDRRRLADEVGFTPRHTLRSGIEDAVAAWRRG